MTVKYIIGVDQSLRNTGVSVHDNTGKMHETFVITTPSGMSDHNSIDKATEEFFNKLEKYFTQEVLDANGIAFFFEDVLANSKNNAKGTARAQLLGVLLWNLRQQGFNVWGVTSSAAYSYLCSKCGVNAGRPNSKDKKKITMNLIHQNMNYYTENDNKADAYMLAVFGYAYVIEKKRLACRPLCQINY